MESGADGSPFVAGVAALLLTAALVWFGTGLAPWWPLIWLAPLPVLLFALRAPWTGAVLAASLAWLLGCLNWWHYFHDVLHAPATVFLLFAIEALVFALAVLLFRALVRRRAHWSALLAFPAAWVSFEYLLNLTSLHGTFGSLSYSQLGFLPLLQVASLTGPWGVSFAPLLFSTTLATAWQLRGRRSTLWRVLGAGLGAIGLVLLFGAWRLAQPAAGPVVKVGLVASDAPQYRGVVDEGPPTARMFADYAEQAAALAGRGAQVVVLPEKLGVAVDPDTRETDALFQALADRTQTDIVVGLIQVTPPLKYNRARVYAPGAPVVSYDKQHMLPPFELQFKAGTDLTLLARPSGTWGVAICKDMDFTPLSRRYGHAGAGLLLVPAWDFVLDRWAHGHMAVMRGVESGFTVARSARQGYLTVSDERGRILAETTSDAGPFATLLVDVPVAHHGTLYLLWGDWFAWLALALLALSLLQLVWRRPA